MFYFRVQSPCIYAENDNERVLVDVLALGLAGEYTNSYLQDHITVGNHLKYESCVPLHIKKTNVSVIVLEKNEVGGWSGTPGT